MGFSAKQVKALRRNLDHRYVRTREANGRELSYIEGWYAISEANRIFGFDGWSRETVESRCVLARENRGAFLAVYTARVRISVHSGSTVPLCRGHHRQLHQTGNEAGWWENLKIDAIGIAKDLWKQTHSKDGRVEPLAQSTTINSDETMAQH